MLGRRGFLLLWRLLLHLLLILVLWLLLIYLCLLLIWRSVLKLLGLGRLLVLILSLRGVCGILRRGSVSPLLRVGVGGLLRQLSLLKWLLVGLLAVVHRWAVLGCLVPLSRGNLCDGELHSLLAWLLLNRRVKVRRRVDR